MADKAETFSVRLPETLKPQLDQLARLTNRSRAVVVAEAVESFVQDREAYARDLDDAVNSAESGIGHSGEQVFRWMRSWGLAEELPSPEPDMIPAKTQA